MKISKNSWHYKVYKFATPYVEDGTTTCVYFRGLLKSVILFVALSLAALFLLGIWGTLLAEPIGMTWRWLVMDLPFTPWLGADKETPWFLFWVSVGIHGLVAVGIIGGLLKDTMIYYSPSQPKDGSFRAVMSTHYKGWKEKFCPVVEFVDEE